MMLLLVAACALIDADGRILMTQRPAGKVHAGLWEFPGGKVENGERPEETIVRELREEIGIDPCLECLQPFSFASHVYDDFNLVMPLFLCREWDGFARPREGQALRWIWPDKITDLDLVPAAIELARNVRDRVSPGRRFE
ncbi:MAG: (deoxy)nucleoside triphosphate pyrophosphohydrolase [Hyphomonadaceae bacterium]|nr:(deoxy)nucleoside triphosphate pyrophosphohydrolase [Hyphomonadaceae bacterium]MBC6411482.1 (deoxy)nucleoside triphosphate pyrophosphohydrolase [Hyphomonadaceae bacterium]